MYADSFSLNKQWFWNRTEHRWAWTILSCWTFLFKTAPRIIISKGNTMFCRRKVLSFYIYIETNISFWRTNGHIMIVLLDFFEKKKTFCQLRSCSTSECQFLFTKGITVKKNLLNIDYKFTSRCTLNKENVNRWKKSGI